MCHVGCIIMSFRDSCTRHFSHLSRWTTSVPQQSNKCLFYKGKRSTYLTNDHNQCLCVSLLQILRWWSRKSFLVFSARIVNRERDISDENCKLTKMNSLFVLSFYLNFIEWFLHWRTWHSIWSFWIN